MIDTYLCEISGAKVRKIIQKTAFGEEINTISVQNTIQFVKTSVVSMKVSRARVLEKFMEKMPRFRSSGIYRSKFQCVAVSGIWSEILLFAAHFLHFGPI